MKTIFLLSEFANKKSNSTGYYWECIADFVEAKQSRIVVLATDVEDSSSSFLKRKKIRVPRINKHKVWQRIYYQAILIAKFSLFILLRVRRGDTLICGTNPAALLIVSAILKKFLRFDWVVLAHDIYPETMVAGGLLKTPCGIIYSILDFAFQFSYRSADRMIAIGNDMKSVIVRNKKVAEDKIIVVQNWASDDGVVPSDRSNNPIESVLGFESKDFIFTFFGNLGRLQGVPNLLAAARLLSISAIKILFIGSGYYKSEVVRAANDPTCGNVFYYGEIEPERRNDGLTAGDVSIVSLAKNMYGLGVPSKAYFSMLADKPLLAVMDKDSEISLMLQEHEIGWTCLPDDPKALASLMELIYTSKSSWKCTMRPRHVLEKFYSHTAALEKIYHYLRSDSLST